jgi:superfamily II DNA/RNA helicase
MGEINMTKHAIYEVFDQQKVALFLHLLSEQKSLGSVLAVMRTREAVHSLAAELAHSGVLVDSVHGKKKPVLIETAVKDLKKGNLSVLVITDASARNIDLEGIESIVHIDFPELNEDYQQRLAAVEETGKGVLFSFESPHNISIVEELEEMLDMQISRERAEGFVYEAQALKARPTRNKTPKKGPRSKPLQHKKKKWKPKKYGRN